MMTTMHHDHLTSILKDLDLGTLKEEPTEIFGSRGGAKIWKVSTEKGAYAIKQLSPDLNVNNENTIAKYELSENIAAEFSKHSINTVAALNKENKHLLICANKGYLIYPWVQGYTLGRNQTSKPHAITIAKIIAKLHDIQLSIPNIKPQRFDIHTSATIKTAIDKAIKNQHLFALTLKHHQDHLIAANEQYQSIIPKLQEEAVVTHGDIDQLNVIWTDNDKPMLVDWESARRMNPTQEIVRTGLNWSGIGTNDFNIEIYKKMLDTYLQCGGRYNINHTNAGLYSLYGSMINWILYNIRTACNNDDANSMANANNEILNTVSKLTTLNNLIPRLRNVP